MNVTQSDLVDAWTMVNQNLKQQQRFLGQWCTAAYACDHWDIVHEKTLEVFALELEQSGIARSIREMETV